MKRTLKIPATIKLSFDDVVCLMAVLIESEEAHKSLGNRGWANSIRRLKDIISTQL